jgi:nitrile hydratase accessory protein
LSRPIEPLQGDPRPAFNEPWQAEAYALVQVLIELGRISPQEWASAFGAALRQAVTDGEPDSGETYYTSLAEALERVLVAEGTLQEAEVGQRIDDWRAAYNRTPHGKPVRLDGAA